MSGPLVLALRLLMAAALYAFLALALWTIWQDLRLQGQNALARKIPAIRLEVRIRKRAPFSRIFNKPEIILGRDPVCDLLLEDETASARHTKLSFHHGHWWIEDLQSTNGTRLNKTRLTTPTVLTAEDEILCGKTKVIINMGGNEFNS